MLSPTEIQRLASDPNYSVYVSASAGTGKTKILCDRYLRLMLNNTPPENILCVTFTVAAAAEMEQRIRSTLSKWNDLSDEDLKKTIVELTGNENDVAQAKGLYDRFLLSLSRTRIQNLHSFCMDILQCYVDTEKPSSNKVIDTFTQSHFIKEAFASVVNKQENKECIDILAHHYSYESLFKLVLSIVKDKTRLYGYAGVFSKESIFKEHGTDINFDKEVFEKSFWEGIPSSVLALGLPKIADAINDRNLNGYKLVFLTQDGKPRKKIMPKSFAGDISCIPLEIDRIQQYIDNLNSFHTAEATYAILAIAYETLKEYEVHKSKSGFSDFDDLLLNTIYLLQNSELAASVLYNLDCRIDHILVDEAQDLSLKQWQVINLISEEFFAGVGARDINRTMFIVGDYKQSIYSFQGANPAIFLQMKDFYKQRVLGAGCLWREIELEYSFRTTQPVLSVVDKIFSTNHIPFRNGDGHKELLELVEKDKESKQLGSWKFPEIESSKQECRQILAEKIAGLIDEWLQQGRLLAGHKRQIKPSDILVLVRKRSVLTKALAACFTKRHIPYVHQDKVRLSEELMVKDMLALANFILLPVYDFNLACLLKSPLIGCNDDELFRFAFKRPAALYDALDENIKAELKCFQELSQALPSVYEFFSAVLDGEGKRLNFVARFGRRANFVLDQFLEAALAFEQNYISAFPAFIEWIENGGADDSSPQFCASGSVRIMTVHSAKGLQAPIVIIADAASSEQTPNEQIFWHDNKFYFSALKELDSNKNKQIKNFCKQAQAEESQRLLYVAMTRAEDELYIAGWGNKQQASWYNLIAQNANNIIHQPEYAPIEEVKSFPNIDLPEFLTRKYGATLDDLPITITATEKAKIKTPEIMRGEIIHDLLHKLPLCSNAGGYFDHIKNTYINKFTLSEFDDMYNKAQIVIGKFPEFFTHHTLSEVPVAGVNNVNARIDKLVVGHDFIKIIDFKSDKTQDNISHYYSQLRFYQKLIKEIYPDKLIESYILWTENGEMTKVNI